jgi:hypothetical protein
MSLVDEVAGALQPDEWSAIAATGTLVVAVIAAVFAFVQVRQARRVREEQAAPYVIVQFESSEAAPHLRDVVVRNIGTTPAFDITISVSPDLIRADEIPEYPFMKSKPVREGIKMLAPGQKIRMFFDSVADRNGAGLPSEFQVEVQSKNSKGKKLPAGRFTLDIDWGRDSVHTSIRNLHWIGARIENVEKSLKTIAQKLK